MSHALPPMFQQVSAVVTSTGCCLRFLLAITSIMNTSLHNAARSGDVEKVRRLLRGEEVDENSIDEGGRTPLHYACAWGQLDVVMVLISEFRADMRVKERFYGGTDLMLAAVNGHEDIVHVMCEYQCPLDIRDNRMHTVALCL